MSTDCLFSMYHKLLGPSCLHVVSRAAVGKAPGAAWRVPVQGRFALSRLSALCGRREGKELHGAALLMGTEPCIPGKHQWVPACELETWRSQSALAFQSCPEGGQGAEDVATCEMQTSSGSNSKKGSTQELPGSWRPPGLPRTALALWLKSASPQPLVWTPGERVAHQQS